MSRNIIIDLDSTVADLMTPWLARINACTSCDGTKWLIEFNPSGDKNKPDTRVPCPFCTPLFTLQDVKEFKFSNLHPVGVRVFDHLLEPGLFRNLKPLGSAIEVLMDSWGHGDKHYIVSDAVTRSETCVAEKRAWCAEHLPWIPPESVFILDSAVQNPQTKIQVADLLNADIAIDDAPHHLIDFAERRPSMKTVCIGYEYNRHTAGLCDFYVSPDEHEYDFTKAWNRIRDYLRGDV